MDFDNDNDQTMNTLIADIRQKQPVDILLENEQTEELSKSIETLLDNNILSSKQKQQIRMYYFEDATLSTIGKKFGVSREAIRQNIKRGLDLIKSYDKNNN
jgi:RNA polymerase sigma factor (sigma-70 family)